MIQVCSQLTCWSARDLKSSFRQWRSFMRRWRKWDRLAYFFTRFFRFELFSLFLLNYDTCRMTKTNGQLVLTKYVPSLWIPSSPEILTRWVIGLCVWCSTLFWNYLWNIHFRVPPFPSFLNSHQNVRLTAACCLVDILRIYAPDAPYCEAELQVRVVVFAKHILNWLCV